MTLDANFIIGLITGAILAWILHWLIYRNRTGDAAHAVHDHQADSTAADLEAARAEITSLQETHESEIASCEEKLADAEAEIGLLRDRLENQAALMGEAEPAETEGEVETTAEIPPSPAAAVEGSPGSGGSAPAGAEAPAAVETPAQPAETASPPPVGEPDDLKKIEGIGPKIEEILHAAGILTYSKLAGTSVAALERIVRDDGGIKVAYPDTWPQQAGLAAADKWDDLDRLQDTLKGGRRV